MQTPPRPTPPETTEALVRSIGQELTEIEQAMRRCRRDGDAESRLTGSWMAHLLICSAELLHNLLIDTASRPQRIRTSDQPEGDGSGSRSPADACHGRES